MRILKLAETTSTNSWLSTNENNLEAPLMVYSEKQTAGRGQRGASWESEPGKNLTASLLLRLESFQADKQFLISEAIALSIVELLSRHGVLAEIKWPNDIYVGNDKICGILVENVVTGSEITRTIAGFGLNVNQEKFISDAPNPVSMKMLTQTDYEIETLANELSLFIENNLELLSEPELLHSRFMENLWRNDSHFYPFLDKKREELIYARIDSVAPDGILKLITTNGEPRNYAFKEIEFQIENPEKPEEG